MIQGPVRPIWIDGRPTFGDAIHNRRPLTRRLIDAWVETSIHVAGRQNWIIVKAQTHGAVNGKVVLGDAMHEASGTWRRHTTTAPITCSITSPLASSTT